MKQEFEIWDDVSIGYWNSKEFIQDRIKQQYDWLRKLYHWLENKEITQARYVESSESALGVIERLKGRLKELGVSISYEIVL